MTSTKRKIIVAAVIIAIIAAIGFYIKNENDRRRYEELKAQVSEGYTDVTVVPDELLTEEELETKNEILEKEAKENEIFDRVLGKTFEYTNPILGNTQTITFTSRSKELLLVGSYIRTSKEIIEDESILYEFEFNDDFTELRIRNADTSQKGNFELTDEGFIFNNAEFIPSDIEAMIQN